MAEADNNQKQVLQDFLHSKAIFQTLLDHMLEALIILGWDGTILFTNRAAATLVQRASEGTPSILSTPTS